MSNKGHELWTNREKVDLLVNVLQSHHGPDLVPYLVHLVQENRIVQPQWIDIPLPEGRSMRASQDMFGTLMQNPRAQAPYPQSATLASPYPPTIPQTRIFTEPAQLQHIPRAIQPRPSRSTDSPAPASTNGEGLTIVRTVGPEFGVEKRKKRGRPTKEEAEERDRLLAAEGKVYEPKKRPSKKFRASTGTPVPVGGESSNLSPSAQTPARTIESKEDSSSGKRRLRRQASQISVQPPPHPMSPRTRPSDDPERSAESPSDRLLARLGNRGGGERIPLTAEPAIKIQPPPTTSGV
ncbi:uncharacterized protein HMPREF1541_02778 [Cyphellophora europaea CBS 101466]|uniref:Uncharacterized protein n=1 Tax=Cyphellophora europaea (strain CBS 101466) TaxID=1220924 RepID=W2S6Q5_CYPE1|nr:uncharacterized protein HMPREF1541_02778 [Cyphellophora europaea CBS 101466]ETN43619.1 hypothetical protein HMPREF1541_02778 [Cyphellophora europaea CBS 101466]